MKSLFLASLAAALVGLRGANGESSPPNFDSTRLTGDSIVAKGKGFEITRHDMDQVLATASVKNPGDELPSDAGFHVLTHLIEIHLVMQKTTEQEKAEGKQKNDEKFATIEKTLGKPEFEHRLRATHMTADELRRMLFQEDTAQTSLTRQLGIKVTQADAKKYFDANPGAFDQPEKARVRELLLLTTSDFTTSAAPPLPPATVEAKRKQIFDLRQRVRDGEDFSSLVKQYNEGFISKSNGEVTSRRGQMEYGDLAFSMETNQISEVITTDEGYLFFQLLEKIPARKVAFAEVADRVKKMLIGQQKRQQAPAYIRQLRTEAAVEILDPQLKAAIAANEAEAAEAASRREALNSGLAEDASGPPDKL